MYVRRLERDTGVVEYLKAISILRGKHRINLQLRVIEGSTQEDELRELARELGINMQCEGVLEDSIKIVSDNKVCRTAGHLSTLKAMVMEIPIISTVKTLVKHQYFGEVLNASEPISIQICPEGVADEIARLMKSPELWENISRRS